MGEKTRQGLDESVGGERGGHPLVPPMRLVEGGGGDAAVPVERAAGGRGDRCRRRAPAVGARAGVEVPEADRGSMTAVSSASLRSHSSSSSKTTCQMSSPSVETSWSVTVTVDKSTPVKGKV